MVILADNKIIVVSPYSFIETTIAKRSAKRQLRLRDKKVVLYEEWICFNSIYSKQELNHPNKK